MAGNDRKYRKLVRRKTMLAAEKEYKDILLRDCQTQAQQKTEGRNNEKRKLDKNVEK